MYLHQGTFYSTQDAPPSTITGYKYMQDYLHSTYNAYVRGRGCGFLAVWIYLWYVKSYISLLLWLKNFGPCKVTTLIIEVNMYIEDNAAEKRGKFREEGNINSFMNIVDWEKLVKYLSTIECERENDRGRDKFPNEKCLSPVCTLSSFRVHSIGLKCILKKLRTLIFLLKCVNFVTKFRIFFQSNRTFYGPWRSSSFFLGLPGGLPRIFTNTGRCCNFQTVFVECVM